MTLYAGLANPRGLLRTKTGALLVAEAGTGDPEHRATGRLLELVEGPDGMLALTRTVLDGQPSVHIVERLAVNRDEVFGFAEIAEGGGVVLASVADPTEGSVLWRVDVEPQVWGRTAGNANSLAWHPTRRTFYAVQSFANTLVDVTTGETVAVFPPLPDGQDAVPAAVVFEPGSDALLVALFGGQRGGDTAGSGVDFVPGSGVVVRVDLETGKTTDVVTGLTAPVDLSIGPRGALDILEFCDGFVDPTPTLEEARTGDGSGGFTRYSGRILRVTPKGGVMELESGLDLPTHMLHERKQILVTEGQGTPGRTIPGLDGPTTIEGRIVAVRPPNRQR